jgi:hypothetical protein
MGLHNNRDYQPVITDAGTVLWFGQYQNQTISLILQEDPGYLVWAAANVEGFDLHYSLLEMAELDADRTRWELMSEYFWR